MLKKMLSGAAAASAVLLAATFSSGAASAAQPAGPVARATTALHANQRIRPLDSGMHCNSQVCIEVSSAGGSGPDIQNASVATNGGWDLSSGTAVYLQYGPSPTAARHRAALETQRTTGGSTAGYNFAVFRTLRVGWYLCGRIQGVAGYPCITVGRSR
jgi:hypothetical protein